jgi:hypothetical protein
VEIANRGFALRGVGKMRSGTAVLVDDPAREKVADRLPGRGFVGAEKIIEAQVLADDDDQVFDRRYRGARRDGRRNGLGVCPGDGQSRRCDAGKEGEVMDNADASELATNYASASANIA